MIVKLTNSIVVLTFAFVMTPLFSTGKNVSGIVFEDANHNGKRDPDEQGISNISVSNQFDVVKTDADGRYSLSIDDQTIIFITKPPDYEVPVNENRLPQFYYIHQPNGSPKGLKFAGIPPTGELPESVDFPLIKTERKNRFKAIVTGDPQPRGLEEVNFYRDDIVSDMKSKEAEFYLALGDVAYDNLAVYDQLNRAVAQLDIPAYNVHGNHDMNYQVTHDRFAAETFKRHFGPEYYSFEYGNVHFIVLDDVEYAGWDTDDDKRGGYRGYLPKKQLKWLENDLAWVPEDYLITLTMHIPIASALQTDPRHLIANRQALFELLKDRKHLLALAGHYHVIEHIEFIQGMDWPGETPFPGITTGAGCGAWWSGPPDSRGIPESICMDGSPNGYFVFTFDGNRFNHRFYPADHSPEYQMRISNPGGILSPDSLENQQIVVNVFNGCPKTKVQYVLDQGNPVTMQRTIMKDPFMVKYLTRSRHLLPDWIRDVNETNHIWSAPLPTNLAPGTHTIAVTAQDPLGNLYSGYRLFEIASEKKAPPTSKVRGTSAKQP